MTLEPNPFKWSQNLKTLTQGVVLISTIIGSAWGAASYIGGTIYHFAEVQTTIIQQIKGVQVQLSDAKSAVADSNTQRERALNSLEGKIVPRVDKLEDAIQDAKTEAAAAKQRVDDMKEALIEIKSLTRQSLDKAASHDDDIKATRNAVAPKTLTNPR